MTVEDRAHVGREPWGHTSTEFYIPGRKGPQRPVSPEPHADELESLLSTPRVLLYRGVSTKFYRIGDLARALNRKPVTIRKWQDKGFIPKPSFGAKTAALGGKIRLYSYDQVKTARVIAAEEGILSDTTKAITRTRFTERVFDAWKELQ